MEGRGRKSAASLSVISGGVIERIDPPTGLTGAQSDLFRQVIASKPSAWFTPDNVPLLTEYVRAVDMADRLAVMIEAATEGGEVAEVKSLLDMRDKEVRRLESLATKMRLAQQSSYNALSADTAKRRAATGTKPWQREKG